jgi:nucleoside-diphosphate-sugar epimerase
MKIFVTGASGWIGSAVVPELLSAGHQVVGLARSDESAEALHAAGVTVIRGDIDDLNILRQAAAASDGVIHLAFKHELAFSGNFKGAAYSDRQAVEVFAEALKGTDKPLVIASGVLGLTPGKVATEQDGHQSEALTAHGEGPAARLATAEYTLSLKSHGIRSVVMRLPPTNHGDGDNRWPAVHRLDSARLFRLAVEQAPAGSTLHAVAEEGIAIRDIAEVIGRQLHLPVVSIAPEEAAEHFSWLANFLALDSPASSTLTRELMGWQPSHPGLIADLDQGHYFKA